MKKMKKFLVVLFIIAFATTAWGKMIDITVDFEYDPDFNADTQALRLYYQDPAQPDVLILVDETSDVTTRSWEVIPFDLPPGKTSDFFVSSVYTTGEEEMSPPYPFKFTGKPTIIDIRKR